MMFYRKGRKGSQSNCIELLHPANSSKGWSEVSCDSLLFILCETSRPLR